MSAHWITAYWKTSFSGDFTDSTEEASTRRHNQLAPNFNAIKLNATIHHSVPGSDVVTT